VVKKCPPSQFYLRANDRKCMLPTDVGVQRKSIDLVEKTSGNVLTGETKGAAKGYQARKKGLYARQDTAD
jgi:hypothetical protein